MNLKNAAGLEASFLEENVIRHFCAQGLSKQMRIVVYTYVAIEEKSKEKDKIKPTIKAQPL